MIVNEWMQTVQNAADFPYRWIAYIVKKKMEHRRQYTDAALRPSGVQRHAYNHLIL